MVVVVQAEMGGPKSEFSSVLPILAFSVLLSKEMPGIPKGTPQNGHEMCPFRSVWGMGRIGTDTPSGPCPRVCPTGVRKLFFQ